VWKLDRLGAASATIRGLKFHSLTEAIDTATPTGRAMWQMIGVLAELERPLIYERTRTGAKAAQRRGVKFGRKVKLTSEQIEHARKLIDKREARQYVADLVNVGRSTLYRALRSDLGGFPGGQWR
jgi:DNA invertase Pin-like site-specific DNA recombinase